VIASRGVIAAGGIQVLAGMDGIQGSPVRASRSAVKALMPCLAAVEVAADGVPVPGGLLGAEAAGDLSAGPAPAAGPVRPYLDIQIRPMRDLHLTGGAQVEAVA